MKEIKTLDSKKYEMLECFLKSDCGKNGIIRVMDGHGGRVEEAAGENYYRWVRIELKPHTEYQLEIVDAEVSAAYLSGSPDMLEEGICYVGLDGDTVIYYEGGRLTEFYDTPYREQYHYAPFMNWVNDPNGLCWSAGYYHLYFQANPHGQEWNNMYWGHAASKDLVHWKHLPYVLQPQAALYEDASLKGGAFSGSAAVLGEETYFYLTRHEGPQEDGSLTREWQTMTSSRDMLNFEEETVIIEEKPEGVGHDFRDPKVFQRDGKWFMVLAGNLDGDSAILLYGSEDMRHWDYVGPLLTEEDRGSTTFECPDCFELDGKTVAVGALMKHRDEYGRYQMTRYYVGNWKEGRLEVENKGWYDFGSNFYAVQSFEQGGRRIAIGWISDFYQEHITVEKGAYGSFAIPRVLSLRGNRLCMEPVREIYMLKDGLLYEGRESGAVLEGIEGNAYYAAIELRQRTNFHILLGRDGEREISLICRNGVTEFKTAGVKSEGVRFVADAGAVSYLEIFVDRRVVEVFLNHGEAAGTKLFYNSNKKGSFAAEFENTAAVESISVYRMKSIWETE